MIAREEKHVREKQHIYFSRADLTLVTDSSQPGDIFRESVPGQFEQSR